MEKEMEEEMWWCIDHAVDKFDFDEVTFEPRIQRVKIPSPIVEKKKWS